MKKLISILLCVAMVLSLAAVTFAEETETLVVGENIVTIPASETGELVLVFTAEEDGYYDFVNNSETGYIKESYYSWVDPGDSVGEMLMFAGDTYEIKLYDEAAETAATEFALTITYRELPEVNDEPVEGENFMFISGEEATDGQILVSFVAERDGTYIITDTDADSDIRVNGSYGNFESKSKITVDVMEGESYEFYLYNYDLRWGDVENAYIAFTIEWTEYVEPHNDLRIGTNRLIWTAGYDDQYVEMVVEQTGVYTVTNNMPGWDKIYINDGSSFGAGQSKMVYLEAGQTLKLRLDRSSDGDFFLTLEYREGTIEPDGSSDYPFALVDGMTIKHSLEEEAEINYVFTPEEDMVLNLTGVIGVDLKVYCGGYVDYTMLADGVYTMNLEGGSKATVTFGGYYSDAGEVDVVVSMVPGELPANGTYDYPFELMEGEWNITMPAAGAGFGKYYEYTALADGTLTFTFEDPTQLECVDTDYLIGDMTDMGDGVYALEMEEGDTIRVAAYNDQGLAINIDATVAFNAATTEDPVDPDPEEPEEPEDPEEPETPTMVLGDNHFDVESSYSGLDVIFVAPKDGTYIFTITNDGPYMYVYRDGSYYASNETPVEITLQEGEELVVCFERCNEVSVNVAEKVETPVDPDPVPDGDASFLFFAMVVLSMTGLVVLVSKKRSF